MNEHIFILPFRDENGCQCWDVRPHDEDANLQAYYNKELEMTIGPKYHVSTKGLDELPQTI